MATAAATRWTTPQKLVNGTDDSSRTLLTKELVFVLKNICASSEINDEGLLGNIDDQGLTFDTTIKLNIGTTQAHFYV